MPDIDFIRADIDAAVRSRDYTVKSGNFNIPEFRAPRPRP